MQSITNAVLNLLFVSIPEEAFIAIIALTFLKELDNLFDIYMWKNNLKWLMIATLPTSILVCVLRFMLLVPQIIVIKSAMALMITSMIYIVIKNSDKITILLIFKTAMFTLAGFVITGILESVYCPIIFSLLHKPQEFFNNVFLYNFLLGLPARVLYTCVVVFIIMKKNGKVKVNLFDTLIKSKLVIGSFIVTILSVVSLIIYVAKLVNNDGILLNLQFIDQFIIIVIVTSFPTILITLLLIVINYLISGERKNQQMYENVISDGAGNKDMRCNIGSDEDIYDNYYE